MLELFDRLANQQNHLRPRRASQNPRGSFDNLERHELLAFSGTVDFQASLVTLAQVSDAGETLVKKRASNGDYSVTDGDGTKTFAGLNSLRLELQNNLNNELPNKTQGRFRSLS